MRMIAGSALLMAALAAAAMGQTAPTDLNSYVLFGARRVKIGKAVVVQGAGAGSNGVLSAGQGADIQAFAVADRIVLSGGAVVQGFVVRNLLAGNGTVLGGQFSPLPLPVLVLTPVTVTPGTGHIVVPPRLELTIPGGAYTTVDIGAGARVTLTDSLLQADEFLLRGNARERPTEFFCAALGGCTVRVGSRLVLQGDVGTSGSALNFEYAGLRAVSVGLPGRTVRARVVAPQAKLRLRSSPTIPSTFVGLFAGDRLVVGAGATVTSTAIASCGDGVLSPPEDCDGTADAACPGQCRPDCTCPLPGGPVLYSVGPSVLHNATDFGIQLFGENFEDGATVEVYDKTTSALLETLPTRFVSSRELAALLPAGMSVPSGMQRELTARVRNPDATLSGFPGIGHCETDVVGSPIACTQNSDCPSGAGGCITGIQRLTMFNDRVFLNPNSAVEAPSPFGLCDDGSRCDDAATCAGIGSGACSAKVYVTPQQADELWVYNTGTRQFVDQDAGAPGIQGIAVGDNPFHVQLLTAGGAPRVWVVNRFEDALSIVDPETDSEVARVSGASLGVPGRIKMGTEIEFDRAGTRAYVSNQNLDEVQVLDIAGARRDAPAWVGSVDVGVNPRGMATNAADTRLYVANIQSADISVVDIEAGSPTENQVIATVASRATDDIVGGRADGWEAFVISGRAPRGIVYSDAHDVVFVTSIGPQTGPRQGVVQVGGAVINPTVTVIDGATNGVIAHVALNGTDPTRFKCTDPELMALDDTRGRLYVTCQGSGTVDVLDTAALVAGTPAEVAMVALPLPTDVPVPTLTLSSQVGGFGARVCAAFTSNAGTLCTTNGDCTGCPSLKEGLPVECCAFNNPIGIHNGPRGIALSADGARLEVVNQFTTSLATLDVGGTPASIAVTGTTSFPGAFGSDTEQRDRRLGQIEFFTDLKGTNTSCATCHIDDHQDGLFFEADVAGPRLRRVLSVRGTRDFPPLLQDQLLPDLVAFTDIVVHVERGGPICTPCTELGGSFFCFPAPEGTCTLTTNAENQANTLYAKGIAFFPNPNLEPDGAFSTTVPLPGGGTGDAVHGEQVFDSLACATCHPEPMFTIDQFRVFTPVGFSVQSTRMREVLTPVHLPLRARCQDANRPTGTDGSTGFSVPTLRGIWDTFPLLMSGAAGFEVTGPEPTFTLPCTPGSSGCCTQLRSPLNPAGTPFLGQQLTVSTKDAMRALLTAPLAVPGTGHGAALALAPGDLDDLIAYLRSL
jgi:DNA-binding beta-propeller fold protein YncE